MFLFGWLRPRCIVVVKRGGRGRWRWAMYRDGELLSLCAVRGYATSGEAVAASKAALRGWRVFVRVETEAGEFEEE